MRLRFWLGQMWVNGYQPKGVVVLSLCGRPPGWFVRICDGKVGAGWFIRR